jgi:hypothetical protein
LASWLLSEEQETVIRGGGEFPVDQTVHDPKSSRPSHAGAGAEG